MHLEAEHDRIVDPMKIERNCPTQAIKCQPQAKRTEVNLLPTDCVDLKGNGALTLPDGTQRDYPVGRHHKQIDNYHGVEVSDPYRPLESLDSTSTKRWVRQENKLTRDFLDKLPGRDKIHNAVLNALHDDKRGLPKVSGDQLFYLKTEGESQGVICRSDFDGKNETVVFDPNPMSKEGLVGVNNFEVSPDGKSLAYGVQRNGTDWVEWKVRDLTSGKDLPGRVTATKFGDLQWNSDSKGIFYSKFDRPEGQEFVTQRDENLGQYFHKVGTSESKDQKVGEPGVPSPVDESREDGDGNYLQPVGQVGTRTIYQASGDKVPTGSIRCVDSAKPDWVIDFVPQGKDTLQNVVVVGDQVVAHYLEDGHSRLERFDENGDSLGAIELPGYGFVNGLRTAGQELIFDFSGPTIPPSVFKLDPSRSAEPEVLFQAKASYNPADYQTDLLFAPSKDGTKVPLYISHRKDTSLEEAQPAYLYGYGGFNVSEAPENKANLNIIPWLDMGGVFVDACLRGGGEYGGDWHAEGQKLKKQNVFDDFIGSAEFLMRQGITKPGKLAIGGRSNGGLLAAATEMQRPDLFAAVIPEVGVMDMMRFPRYTAGKYWVSEYGDVSKKSEFKKMLSYSPLHCAQNSRPYPSTMILTGDHDDRVVPSHSYKLAATMQQSQVADKPVLLRVERNTGHGSVDHPWPTAKLVGQDTDRWSFLAQALNVGA
jgi:prolyl oligopeptidase